MGKEEFELRVLGLVESILTPRILQERIKILETQKYLAILAYRQLKIFLINLILTFILIFIGVANIFK